MFAIDRWMEPAQPEILKKYSRCPEAEEAVVLRITVKVIRI